MTLPKGVFRLCSTAMKVLQHDVRKTFTEANLMTLMVQAKKGVWVEELDLRDADPVLRSFVQDYIVRLKQ